MTQEIKSKMAFFESFWKGEGPFPILFAKPHLASGKNYIEYDLVKQHNSAELLFKEALIEEEQYRDVIDDGIPVIRSDLGTTLLPSGLGFGITVQENAHPWMKEHISSEEYLEKDIDSFPRNGEIPLAVDFYRRLGKWTVQQGSPQREILPYIPDTQGIFDLSHLVLGTDVFFLFADDTDLLEKIQEKSLELYLYATRFFKKLIKEQIGSMVHGHGMNRGVWFQDTGARICEDSGTLISQEQIDKFCLPYMKKAIQPFGRGFVHYCGKHDDFLKSICAEPLFSAVNLGNPESYDSDEVLRLCGESDTVFFNHLPKPEDEDGESFIERVADSAMRNGAKVILIYQDIPDSTEKQKRLRNLWHRRTGKVAGPKL